MPDDIVELIAWHATQDPDGGGDLHIPDRAHGPRLHLVNSGINASRGRAAGAIARLLDNGAPLDPWRSTVLRLASDNSDAVRACAAQTLLAALRLDREWVAAAMTQMVAGKEVATSAYAERLLWSPTFTHPQITLPIIEKQVASSEPEDARVGGRLAALAGLASADHAHIANEALMGSPGARLGVAEVYAANVGDESTSATCRDGLIALFVDGDSMVRREAATAFQNLRGTTLARQRNLVTAFVEALR